MEECYHGKDEGYKKEQNLGDLCSIQGTQNNGCKWVFSLKYKAYGTLDRHKTMLVAKGFTQTCGVDYSKTFSAICCCEQRLTFIPVEC